MITILKPVMMNANEEKAAGGNGLLAGAQAEPQQETKATPQQEVASGDGLLAGSDNPLGAEQPVEQVATQQVAVQQQTTEVATQQTTEIATVGEEGLGVSTADLRHDSFPKVKISNGEFQSDDTPIGKKLAILPSRPFTQFLITPKGEENPTKEQLAYFMKGSDVTTQGAKVADFKASLEAQGYEPQVTEYLMVPAKVLKSAVLSPGTLIMLQISPTGIGKFNGAIMANKANGIADDDQAILLEVGAPVKASNNKTYNPLVAKPKFSAAKMCEALGISMGAESVSYDDMDF